ncbi:MAG: penicillin acylase family protein [Chloroflexota bacterium]|jgi:penicillin amidase
MPKGLKIVLIIVGLIAVIALVAVGIIRAQMRQAWPQTSGTVQINGLDGRVEVVRDEYGVPHIYAQTEEDLFFAQGYVHAQDRFWQMEFQRRTGAGRLSEIFGEATLATDRYLRHFGFYDLAQASYDMDDETTKALVDAYTAGVNAYIADRDPDDLAFEFTLLGLQGVKYEIEPWQPADSFVWGYMLIFDQASLYNVELTNLKRLAKVGSDLNSYLLAPYRDDRPVIIQKDDLLARSGLELSPLADLDQEALDYVLAAAESFDPQAMLPGLLTDLGFGQGGASNSFAISGDLTETGMPMLANDPHMSINIPNLWHEVGLHCVEKSADCVYEVRGFSLPGVPGILIGHNDRIAWGLTNAAFDPNDVFIERINPENPNQYEVNGEWQDMTLRREEITVRGQDEPEIMVVRRTRNGVVITDGMSDVAPYSDGEHLYALTMAWTGLDPVGSLDAVQHVLRAQGWDDFVAALANFDAGQQNWLYADVDGNIGYVLPGKIPIRAGGDGTLPVPGWNDDYIWTGYIPYEELPRTFNPSTGYIVTANNPQVRPAEYPYLLGLTTDRGQRAQQITNMVEGFGGGISMDDMSAMQTSNKNLSALEIIPYLDDLTFDDPALNTARSRLQTWDAEMTMDSAEAALFNIFWAQLLQRTFNDQLPTDLAPRGQSDSSDTIYMLLQEPDNPWWDDLETTGEVEDRDAILSQAFEAAYDEGVETFGKDLDTWKWGDLHTIEFVHATLGRSGIGVIENIFNRGPFRTNGSESVPQKTCWDAQGSYEVRCIPALRQVIDLGDLGNSRMVHAVGQSGHPSNDHYDDFIDPWRLFEYHPSNWQRSAAEAGEAEVLVLEPGG